MHTVLQLADFAVIAFLVMIPLVIISAMLGVAARGSGVNLKSRELARLARLEGKVDFLLQHAGLTYDNGSEVLKYGDVRAAVESGDTTKAVMLYAEATGVSLPDAKLAIQDAMARGVRR